jgi:hypothetical protein
MKVSRILKIPRKKREQEKPRLNANEVKARIRKLAEEKYLQLSNILQKKGLKPTPELKDKFISNFVHFTYIWFGYPLSEHDVDRVIQKVISVIKKPKSKK